MNAHRASDSREGTLDEHESALAQWSRIDTLLRRLVTRLTYAAEGHAAPLDLMLDRIRSEMRNTTDEPTIEQLLHELTEAVRSLDDLVAPNPGVTLPPTEISPPGNSAGRDALLAVLDRLQLDETMLPYLGSLRAAILETHELPGLAQQAEALASLVNHQLRQLSEHKHAAETLLAHVTEQLVELTGYITREDADQRDGSGARLQLNQHLIREIDALGSQMRQTNDLHSLRREVESRIGAISTHMKAFREREEKRERDWQARAQRMSQRIRELEHAAQSMEVSLNQKQEQAATDPLTGIANRRVYEAHIVEICKQVRQNTSEVCLLVLDIDHFKHINDRFGHAAGDRALRIVADQLKARLRAGDLLARYGGEEFVVVLPGTSAQVGLRIAETLRAGIEGIGFRGQQQPVSITLSCGVTQVQPDDTANSVFERADRALYQAKRRGRNRCEMG